MNTVFKQQVPCCGCSNHTRNFKETMAVMTACREPAVLLHQVDQELDADEKETMLFLCRDLSPNVPGVDVRELLMALNEKEMLTLSGLPELLYRIKRFDLLKKLLNMGRADVEGILARHPSLVSPYRVLMSEISENLDKDDLSSLVFLLMDEYGGSHTKVAKDKVVGLTALWFLYRNTVNIDLCLRGIKQLGNSERNARSFVNCQQLGNFLKSERFPYIQSFLSIVTDLEKLDQVSPNHLDLLENCFLHIQRKDLVKKIQKYKREATVHPINSSPLHQNTLQASFPKLALADPPLIINKRRPLNGKCSFQAEQVHIPVPETGGTPVQVLKKYRMQSQPLGLCLIIDCIGNDAAMLADAFRALCFEVHCHLFLNVDSMVRQLHTIAGLREHKDYDCFVCILVSRGDHQGVFCTDHVIPGFPLERIKSFFTGNMSPELLGKPKLFFIQNYIEPGCWHDDTSMVEADGHLYTIPQVADILWSQSTLDASALEKSPGSSYYLTALAELLTDPHKRKLPLLDILVELNSRVYERNRTNPTEQYSLLLKHTLRKKLFLSGG